jgi:hypothetical protein
VNLVAPIARAAGMGALLLSFLTAPQLRAQEIGWRGSAEANASLFFGNTDQWVVAGATRLAFSDSAVEIRGELRADYAETSIDSGGSTVSRRAWLASTGVDFAPFATVSPFLQGSAESSLQQRIHRRYSAGFGGKLTFVQSDDSKLSTSVALLWERTDVMDGNTNPDLDASRLRWSYRLTGSHKLDDRIRFDLLPAERAGDGTLHHHVHEHPDLRPQQDAGPHHQPARHLRQRGTPARRTQQQ